MTAAKNKRIMEIVSLLEKGNDRKDILPKLIKSYKVSAATLDKEIKTAKDIISERNAAKEAIRVAETTKATIDAVKTAIVSDLEIEGILCTIATGNIEVEEIVKGRAILRGVTPTEQVSAIRELWKKRGTYAAEKQDITVTQPIIVEWNK